MRYYSAHVALGALLLCAAGGQAGPAMDAVLMDDKVSTGAVCLDGSPGLFYYGPALTQENANDWVIYFQGGGWCYDEYDCLGRSEGWLGTSKNQNDKWGIPGLGSQNCTVSPTLCNYRHVFLHYCDGNSFAGNRDEPISINGTKLYSRGKRILDAVLDTLVEKYNFSSARNVLVSGCSAGGLAAYLHADYIHDFVQSKSSNLQKFGAAPISGFFLDHAITTGEHIYGEEMKYVFEMTNASSGMNQACLKANVGEEWKCNMAPYTYPHINSRVFIFNSAMDSFQTMCILTAAFPPGYPAQTGLENGVCNAIPGLEDCINNPVQGCNASSVALINNFATDFMAATQGVPTFTKPGNGAFINSCHLHCEAASLQFFQDIVIDGVTLRDAFKAWWEEPTSTAPSSSHTFTPCLYKPWPDTADRRCNPTCNLGAVPPSAFVSQTGKQ